MTGIKKAIRKAKNAFGNKCIFSDELYPDGCHIYGRSYRYLADNEFNIIPLSRLYHNLMDRDSKNMVISPEKRIEFLREHVLPEYKSLLEIRLEMLKGYIHG